MEASRPPYTCTKARTSPRTRISPQAPLTEGYEIGIKLEGSGLSTLPPVLRSFKLDAELLDEQFDRRVYSIKVGQGQPTHGGEDKRNAATVWQAVTRLHRDGVMALRDQEGSLLNIRAHPVRGYAAVEDSTVSGSFTRSGLLPVTVLEIVSGSGIGDGALWGDGTLWGSGAFWGGNA